MSSMTKKQDTDKNISSLLHWKKQYKQYNRGYKSYFFYEWRTKQGVHSWAGPLEQVFGYTPDELNRNEWCSLIHPDDYDEFQAALHQSLQIRVPFTQVYRLRKKDGIFTIIQDNAQVFLDSCGEVERVVGFIADIAEDLQAIKELQERERRYRELSVELELAKKILEQDNAQDEAILTSIGDGLYATDQDRRITIMNRAAQEMLGWSLEDVIGKPIAEIIQKENEQGDPFPVVQYSLGEFFQSIEKTTTRCYYIRRDKTKFHGEVTIAPVLLNGLVVGTVEVFRDITKEMEIERAKSELLSLASHQLRTPLSTISWYSEALLKEYTGPISIMQKNYMDQIYRTTHKMIRLVNDFLNVSRIELGTFHADPEPVNLAEIANSTIDELGAMIKEKRVRINQNYEERIPIINADPHHMRMIFQNLLTNAVKYSETEGEIWVEIIAEQQRVIIKVIDTGCGIPKAQQSKIFTKLFRADNVKGQDTEGTGLGLYIVKSIVTKSNGEIWFESEEGKGSTFYIAIPFYKALRVR